MNRMASCKIPPQADVDIKVRKDSPYYGAEHISIWD